MQAVKPALFGRDHLSTLLYLETRAVDHAGKPDMRNLKCNASRHPYPSIGRWDPSVGTRLGDGTQLPDHDDWDCIEDMVACGWIEWLGTGASPIFALTDTGFAKAHELRVARARRSLQPKERAT